MILPLKQSLELLRAQLTNERASFIPHWRSISDNLLPRRSRFTVSDVNKGERRNRNIIDTSATLASRTFTAGMQAGITSPARPWFRLTTPDPDLADFQSVKEWLYSVQNIMSTTMLRSNIYNTFAQMYKDLGAFGTAPISVEETFNGKVMNSASFPVGSYMIAKDEFGKVDTFMREYRMTIAQLIKRFGKQENGVADWSNFSPQVKSLWESGQTQAWVDIVFCVKPNDEYDPKRLESRYKRFISAYYEMGVNTTAGSMSSLAPGGPNDNRFLELKGFDLFPILCPRWETTGEDVYATDCPGMTALGDILQLQQGEKNSLQAVDKMVRPPMTGPSSMRNATPSILPGDVTFVDVREGQQGFKPAHEVNLRLDLLEGKQAQVRQRISRAFFEDLFLMFINNPDAERTAREVSAKEQEKLLVLGPVLEQLNQDLLDPFIDLSFDYHLRQRLLPPPPPELEGLELKVEYVSIMAQAQKMVGLSGLERFGTTMANIISIDESARDKLNVDEYIDTLGETYSIPPKIIRSSDQANEIRNRKMEAAIQQQKMEQLQAASVAAKNLSQSNLDGDNALAAVASQVQP